MTNLAPGHGRTLPSCPQTPVPQPQALAPTGGVRRTQGTQLLRGTVTAESPETLGVQPGRSTASDAP